MIIKRFYTKDYLEQLKALNIKHFEETGYCGAPDLKLEPAYESFTAMEESNRFLSMGLFTDDDILVGYIGFVVYSSWHHVNNNFAVTDCFLIDKPYRCGSGAIIRMFNDAEALLKKEFNVEYIQLIYSSNIDLGKLGERMGYVPCNVIMLKDIRSIK